MKPNQCKCTVEQTTGWTTVKCCNCCGLPVQEETWEFVAPVLINDGKNPFPKEWRVGLLSPFKDDKEYKECLISNYKDKFIDKENESYFYRLLDRFFLTRELNVREFTAELAKYN